MTRRRNFGFAGAAVCTGTRRRAAACGCLAALAHALWLLHAMLLLLRAAACDAGEQQATHAAVWV
jgi:hypothetical protein